MCGLNQSTLMQTKQPAALNRNKETCSLRKGAGTPMKEGGKCAEWKSPDLATALTSPHVDSAIGHSALGCVSCLR